MPHSKQFVEAGRSIDKATKALIMLHGRGATAEDILSLKNELTVDDFYIIAPQATNYTWYPYSFLEPIERNEPWLTSALDLVGSLVDDIGKAGIPTEKIYLLGFSQGACLTLEFAARHAKKWGGVIAFTGGLIGDKISPEKYQGNFVGTRIFLGNSDQDPHVPVIRSEESGRLLEKMGGSVTIKVYPNMRHTINQDEIASVNTLFFAE